MFVIGQTALINTLNKFTLATLPKSLLFLGEEGGGKKYIAKWLAEYLNIELIKLDKTVSNEQLIDYSQRVIPTIYLIDLTDIDQKQQNIFLKFIEEPSLYSYIVLTAKSEVQVLPTILNRCIKYYFEKYTVDELKEYCHKKGIIKSEVVLDFCKTPGQINIVSENLLEEMKTKAELLLKNISTSQYQSIVGFTSRINCEKDLSSTKYDFNVFIKILLNTAFNLYLQNNDNKYFNLYMLLDRAVKDSDQILLQKENYMLSLLSKMWEVCNDSVCV